MTYEEVEHYLTTYCGSLSSAQQSILRHKYMPRGGFIGVGRRLGGNRYYPLVEAGKRCEVLTWGGFTDFCNPECRFVYPSGPKAYWHPDNGFAEEEGGYE